MMDKGERKLQNTKFSELQLKLKRRAKDLIDLEDLNYDDIQAKSDLLRAKSDNYVSRFLSGSGKFGIKIRNWHIAEVATVLNYKVNLFYDDILDIGDATIEGSSYSIQLLDALFDHSPMGIAFVMGDDFRFSRINQHLADINGFPIEYHLGKRIVDVIPEAANHIIPLMQKIMADGEPLLANEFTISLPSSPKELLHILDYQLPIKDNSGKTIGVCSIVSDRTDLKHQEKKEEGKSFTNRKPSAFFEEE